MTDGRLTRAILRQLLDCAGQQIIVMLMRPRRAVAVAGTRQVAAEATEESDMADNVLEVAGISKRFGGLQALSDVGITIERGQVSA